MRRDFMRAVCDLAAVDPRIILLCGDVLPPLGEFRRRHPDRLLNVGICEQAIVAMAAGMAMDGMRPIVFSVTPFVLERPLEQIKVAIDQYHLPVILVGYDAYPDFGVSHTPMNPRATVGLFKHVRGFFGEPTYDHVIEAHAGGGPAFVHIEYERAQ
jgi:transketolase